MSRAVLRAQGGKEVEARVRWQERLRRFETAGVSVAQFCKEESVSMWSFYRWRGKLARAAGRQGAASPKKAKAMPFIELGALGAGAEQGAAPGLQGGAMELRIEPNGTIVLRLMRS